MPFSPSKEMCGAAFFCDAGKYSSTTGREQRGVTWDVVEDGRRKAGREAVNARGDISERTRGALDDGYRLLLGGEQVW